MTKSEIKKAYAKCLQKSNELELAMQSLSAKVSQALGVEYVADICNGDEIEFSRLDEYGLADASDCVRIEEILEKLNN
ncbi:MAG: hypothetical protein II453_21095 [Alphaproteobacteria bacterium]|nr:hypothetical protein [Alphaproteobacteria bacterium]MBQ3945849.1 hypothetical protein [Alphaproteobacteria bacterium]